jgi:hypothetical protein
MDDPRETPRQPLTHTQRGLIALFAIFFIWFIASAVLVIVGQVGGHPALQYGLGALVVLLIPVMLVVLFIILWPILRGHRTEDEQAVLTRIVQDFPAAVRPEALALLDDYCFNVPEAKRARVQRALLTLSAGDLNRLHYLTEEAKQEYTDLLDWADEQSAPSGTERAG